MHLKLFWPRISLSVEQVSLEKDSLVQNYIKMLLIFSNLLINLVMIKFCIRIIVK
jgi:hypothetical protein